MYSIQPGEQSKGVETKHAIEHYMFEQGLGQDSCLIALGGGVVGDLAGYIASSYHRGIAYVQIPSTLLAQVDSSLGAKTGINVPWGKNLIGAIYPPNLVLIDPELLSTLPDAEYYSGMAEVIKIALLGDRAFFEYLETHSNRARDPDVALAIVKRSCLLKAQVLQKDHQDKGFRWVLNFGHTIGHALEAVLSYRWKHGECIAVGMLVEGYLGFCHGHFEKEELVRLEQLIKKYRLPTKLPKEQDILIKTYNATLSDKKNRQGQVYYSLISGLGKIFQRSNMEKPSTCYGYTVPKELVLEALKRYERYEGSRCSG